MGKIDEAAKIANRYINENLRGLYEIKKAYEVADGIMFDLAEKEGNNIDNPILFVKNKTLQELSFIRKEDRKIIFDQSRKETDYGNNN